MNGWIMKKLMIGWIGLDVPRHATDAGQSPLLPLAGLPRRENVEAMSKSQPEMEQCQTCLRLKMMLLLVPATLAFLQKRRRCSGS